MKTKTINVYSFEELSNEAKENAIQKYREQNWETGDYAWEKEKVESMEAFAKIFPIEVTEWSFGGRGEGVFFRFTSNYDEIEEMTGQRLANYIWNNYKDEIFSRKYYGSLKKLTDKPLRHPKIESHKLTGGENKGKYLNQYKGLTLEKGNCPFTGYIMDDALLQPIYTFLDKPNNTTFRELLDESFEAWVKACNDDREDQDSDEYITESITSNDYEFDENGNML